MGHDGGVLDQAFYAAEALGEGEKMRVLQETASAIQIGIKVDRDHAAERFHLAFR